jgi:hypothetical protein
MYVTVLDQGTRKAKKRHQCFHCYRDIVPGQTYGFQTCKYDHVYTLSWHVDCEQLADECRAIVDEYWDDGWPPLRDMWLDSGEYSNECDGWRGFYPHVVARMELTDQLREAPQ